MKSLKWTNYIPPTARVRSMMNGNFNADGELVADAATKPSAGAFEATLGDLKGYIRGRVLPYLPLSQDFEAIALSETNLMEERGLRLSAAAVDWRAVQIRGARA